MNTADACLQYLSERKHSVWLQKLSETTFIGDIADLRDRRDEMSHIPAEFWRGRIRKDKWHYGTYQEVLDALVEAVNGSTVD